MKRMIGIGTCWLLLLAAASSAADPAADRATLMKADSDFAAASAERGLPAWLSYFAEDASIYLDSEKIVTGLPAIREHYAKIGFSPKGLVWKPQEARVSSCGDMGYTTGRWEYASKGSDGKPVTEHGRYLTTWQKQRDGSWKVISDIGNDDPPAKVGQ